MKLETLSIKNFGSFGNTTQSVNLSDLGLTLLVGRNTDSDSFKSNGAGKSTLLNALVYALYGETAQGEKGDQLINRKIGKNMQVKLTFKKGKNTYRIERYRKDSVHKNKSLLFLNEKNISPRSVRKVNAMMEKIIGIDERTYLHSYVFSGAAARFATASDKDKKAILEDMADLSIYPIAHEIAKDDAKTLKTQMTNLDSKIQSVRYLLKSYEKLQDSETKSASERASNLKSAKDKVIKMKKKLASLGKAPGTHSQSYYENLKLGTKSVLQGMAPKIQSVKPAQHKLSTLQSRKVNCESNVAQIANKVKTGKQNMSDDKAKLAKLATKKQKTCFWCGQKLNQAQRKHEIVKIAVDYNSVKRVYQGYVKQLIEAQKRVNNLAKQIKATKKNMPNVSKINHDILVDNKVVNDCNSSLNQIKMWKNQLKVYAEQYNDLNNKQSHTDYTKKVNDTSKKLKAHVTKYHGLQTKLNLYKQTESVYSNHGVKSMVLDLILPFINQRANHYLQILTSGSIHLLIVPTTTSKSTQNTRERINIKIDNVHGSNNYTELSAGEKRRVDLSIILSLQDYVLSKASTSLNLICFDEVFDNLDDTGVQQVIQLIDERAKKFPNILVISHNSKLQSLFTNYLVVKKHNGVSVIQH